MFYFYLFVPQRAIRKQKNILHFLYSYISKSFIKGNDTDTDIMTYISDNISTENQVRYFKATFNFHVLGQKFQIISLNFVKKISLFQIIYFI